MTLALVAIGTIVLAVGIGFCIGYQAGRGPQSNPPPKNLVELGDALRELVQKIERQLNRHGKSLALDVTALADSGDPAAYAKAVKRIIESHHAFSGEVHGLADDARHLQSEVTRAIVEGELALPVEPATEKEPDFPGDRRKETRHPYFCKQWIAPYSGNCLPELEEFEFVQCRDLSSGGISFFLDAAPETDMFLIRLHGPQGAKYLTARVQQIARSGNAEYGRYVVGCRFLGTLHASAVPTAFEALGPEQPELAFTG